MYDCFWAHLGKDKICEDNEVNLPGITIDNSFKFDTHINNIFVLKAIKSYVF